MHALCCTGWRPRPSQSARTGWCRDCRRWGLNRPSTLTTCCCVRAWTSLVRCPRPLLRASAPFAPAGRPPQLLSSHATAVSGHPFPPAGRVGFQQEMGALDEARLLNEGPPAKPGDASYTPLMLRCCEEVVRRIEDPLSFLFGVGGAQKRAGDQLFRRWQVWGCRTLPSGHTGWLAATWTEARGASAPATLRVLSQELVNTGLLQHIKKRVLAPGSFANLLLSVRDPKTGPWLPLPVDAPYGARCMLLTAHQCMPQGCR